MPQDRAALLQQLKLDKGASNTPPSRPWLWPSACVIAALAGMAVGHWGIGSAASPAPPASPTQIARQPAQEAAPSPSPSSRERILDASGYITARQIATVSAKVMGLISTVEVEEGMLVEEGQVLARIDDTVARINLQLAQAQVTAHEARLQGLRVDLQEAERELVRIQQLERAGNFSSEAQLTKAESLVSRLQSAIAGAQADLQAARLHANSLESVVSDHTIRAPFAGVVTAKNAQAGEIVSPSSAGGGFTRTGICTIVDMNSLEIQVDVNEAYIGRVQPGQEVLAVLDAYPQWQIPARVTAVIPTADRARATVRVRIEIIDKDPRILPDMGVKVSFLSGDHQDDRNSALSTR